MKRGIGEAAVEGIINRYIHQQVDWQAIKTIPLLGIDEIALKKGHKDFVVIVTAINEQGEKHILAVLPDRKKDTVKAFLAAIPVLQKATIQRVCVDMYEGYSNAVYEALSGVVVIVDRFMLPRITEAALTRPESRKCVPLKRLCPIKSMPNSKA